MKYTTKTEYGLVCLVYMARHGANGEMITINNIVTKEQFSSSYIEKIFQKLRAANIVNAHHGKQGGYTLARHPSQIKMKEVIDALEGSTFDIYCKPQVRKQIVCTHFCMCSVRPVWEQTKGMLDQFFGSVTLEMIAKEEGEATALVHEKSDEISKK